MTKSKFRFFAIFFGILVLAGSAYNLYRLWEQPQDSAWTPGYLAQNLSVVGDRMQVLVNGEPLEKALREGRLTMNGPAGPFTLAPSSVTVRVNNYHQVRVTRVPQALTSAAALGGALVLFLLGVFAPALGGALTREERGLTELHLLHES